MTNCLQCRSQTSNPKFCSHSCAASFNNRGVCRVVKKRFHHPCAHCGELTVSKKFCSIRCGAESRITSVEIQKKNNAIRQSRYRSKKYRSVDPTANIDKIKQIYQNCPNGYEVDHVMPLSKGGRHHENNLQYLTIKENRKKGNRVLVRPTGLEPVTSRL